jgi:hypothetical protein
MRHIEAFPQLDIFLAETLALVMLLLPDQVLPALYSENNMDVDLCVGVGYDMPLRWSLSQFFSR